MMHTRAERKMLPYRQPARGAAARVASLYSSHVNDISPAFDIYRLELFLESFDQLVAAGVVNEVVTLILACAEGEDMRRADISLQMPEHLLSARAGRIDAHDLFTFFAVKEVKIHAAAVRPGLGHELLAEAVDVLLMIDHQNIDHVLSDRPVRAHVVAVGRHALFVVESGHGDVSALGYFLFRAGV